MFVYLCICVFLNLCNYVFIPITFFELVGEFAAGESDTRQPGAMIVRSVEIDKDSTIVLIFLCRDSLDWPSGQTRALVTPS